MLSKWRHFFAMPVTQRWLFLKVWCLLHAYEILMPFLGVQTTKNLLSKLPFGHKQAGLTDALIQDHFFALYLSTKYSLVDAKCLARSLTLWQLLRCYEPAAIVVKIGVLKENLSFKAHAWVEFKGQVLNDLPSSVSAYTQISSIV